MTQDFARQPLTLPVTEEDLEVERRTVDTGRTLRVRKQVHTAPAAFEGESVLEAVEVQRVPVGRVVETPPEVRSEGDTTVVPVVEERLVVTRQLVLVEELRLVRRRVARPVAGEATLRKEQVVVERFDPGSGRWQPEPGLPHPTQPEGQGSIMQTVIGVFDDRAQADRAVEQLVADGFDRGDVHIEAGQGEATAGATPPPEEHHHHGFFAWLFGEKEEHQPQRALYGEAVRRGNAVVVVDAQDEAQVRRAVDCLHDQGAQDVDERARQWRSEGWDPAAAGQTATTGTAATGLTGRSPDRSGEGVLDVVQEELQVGKRELEKGGVRVVQRVSQKPVREVVRLREEQAVVDRRKVDRPADASELGAFKEGSLEVRERAEEPVVSKTARVVEEVRVGKQVREREQVVEDSVRRKDVDVERLGESRERAVASDPGRARELERDSEREVERREDLRPPEGGSRERP